MKIYGVLDRSRIAIVLCVVILACVFSCEAAAEQMESESGSFVFKTPLDKKEIRVWYYKPRLFKNTSQIVFVMHGVNRNGEDYRDAWRPHAAAGNFLLLVPEFSQEDYPGSAGYNLGNMFSSTGARNGEAFWSYTVIEDLFDYIKAATRSEVATYSIYGHSAGAQFVHRFVMFKPNARIQTAIAANAGWYTMPTDATTFPYGLKDSGTEVSKIRVPLGKNLIILLGDRDINENDKNLRETAGAMAQGKHRLERGHGFYKMAMTSAQEQKVQFGWKMEIVAGAGHSNSKMSVYAAKRLK